MNHSIFWRLVWKEYRLQRAFWISMALLTVLLQLLVWMTARETAARTTALYGFALGLSAFYALGCGATLFATEHETGTYGFQRVLPVSAIRLFFSKLAFALLSTLLMIGLFWSLAAILASGRLPPRDVHRWMWGLLGFSAVELLVWGMFFSLLLKRPLTAAILGVTTASVGAYSLAWAVAPGKPDIDLGALPYRVVLAAVVALVDVWLGRRWFGETTLVSRGMRRFGRRVAWMEPMAYAGPGAWPSRRAVLGRLIWHHWRQSARMIGVLGAMVAPLVVCAIWYLGSRVLGSGVQPAESVFPGIAVLLAFAAAPLAGSCVFLADQQGHGFRFLTDRGVRPRYVWLSRHLVWTMALLAAGVVALPAELAVLSPASGVLSEAAIIGIGYVILAYSCGQLCSMLFRSGLLAGFFGLVLTGVLCGWAGLMATLGISWLWSVAPLPLVFFLATWLRAPDWLLERNTFRAWLRPGLVLAVPTLAILTAVPLYRIYEIPKVGPGFSPEEYARPITPEEDQTVEMYRRVLAWYVPMKYERKRHETPDDGEEPETESSAALTEKQIAWLKANEKTTTLALEVSRRTACDFLDAAFDDSTMSIVQDCCALERLLVASARQLESEGRLDAAMDRYTAALRIAIHVRHRSSVVGSLIANLIEKEVYDQLPSWAAHPEQTPGQIRAGLDRLDKLAEERPPITDVLKTDYLRMRQIVSADPDALASLGFNEQQMFRINLLGRLFPWEKTRALRMLNLLTAVNLSTLRDAELAAARGGKILREPGAVFSNVCEEDAYWRVLHTSVDSLSVFCSFPLQSEAMVGNLLDDFLWMEARRRAVRLLLALQAWKSEHGQLPNTLDELVGPYLDRLPLDPCLGEPFRYFPEGLPIPVQWQHRSGRGEVVEAGKPLIWSASPQVFVMRHRENDVVSRYGIYSPHQRDPKTEYDVWQSGWLFPLP